MDRKGMKVAAKKAQRKHYWMIVAICLFASVFGVAYTSSTLSVSTNISISTPQTEDSTQSNDMYDVLQDLAVGNENDAREKVKQNQEQIVNNDTDATFGRRRGVIASLLNSFASGSMVIAVADAINSVTHNGGVSIAVLVILSLAVYIFVWLFIQETYRIVMARMLLEGRSYNKLPASRFFYPIHTRKWPRMAWTMFVENVFLFLVCGKRVPVPLESHHRRLLHQAIFLPYGAVHRCGESEYRGFGRHSLVPTHDERA